MAVTGGCLCGAVRYDLTAPMLFGGFCYCADCRKISGSHSASMAVPEAALKVTGETREFSCTSGSGNPVTRVFCPNCGSGILSKGARAGVVMLKAGTLDDPENFKPMASIYASRAPTWDRPREGLPAFPEMPPQS
jgi:hypothetical protein